MISSIHRSNIVGNLPQASKSFGYANIAKELGSINNADELIQYAEEVRMFLAKKFLEKLKRRNLKGCIIIYDSDSIYPGSDAFELKDFNPREGACDTDAIILKKRWSYSEDVLCEELGLMIQQMGREPSVARWNKPLFKQGMWEKI